MTSLQQLADSVAVSKGCGDCGACCMHMASPPMLPQDYHNLPARLKVSIDGYLSSDMRYADVDRPCHWLDMSTGKCRHYEHRPTVCREFEFGGEGCAEAKARYVPLHVAAKAAERTSNVRD